MANPQAENGHTRINHEDLEKLLGLGLTGTQWDIVLTVIRLTWGYNRPADQIALGTFESLTRRHRNGIRRELKTLLKAGILIQDEPAVFNKPARWRFNKDWEQWRYTPLSLGHPAVTGTSRFMSLVQRGVRPSDSGVSPPNKTPKENLLKKEKRASKSERASAPNRQTAKEPSDPRWQPLVAFMFSEYAARTGLDLSPVFRGGARALSYLITATPGKPEYSLERLRSAWSAFLECDDDFVQRQHPVRWFCEHINSYLGLDAGRDCDDAAEAARLEALEAKIRQEQEAKRAARRNAS